MKDEIKQMIDNLKFISEQESATIEINQNGCKVILDYITNLQEELEEEKRIEQESLKTIQELEEKLYNLTHTIFTGRNYNEVLKSEQDYKSRNEKAIEYIKRYESIRAYYEYQDGEYWEFNYDDDFQKELLNILQGEDKDE